MTNETTNSNGKELSPLINRILYGAFVLLGCYFLVFTDEFMSGVTNLGIALVFDPFDQRVKWGDRKFYQKAWMIVHLAVLLALFVYGVFIK
jgi:hypothetical protein